VPVFPKQEKLPAHIVSIGIVLSNAVNFAEDFLQHPLIIKLTALHHSKNLEQLFYDKVRLPQVQTYTSWL
jgi:hypothetical protein